MATNTLTAATPNIYGYLSDFVLGRMMVEYNDVALINVFAGGAVRASSPTRISKSSILLQRTSTGADAVENANARLRAITSYGIVGDATDSPATTEERWMKEVVQPLILRDVAHEWRRFNTTPKAPLVFREKFLISRQTILHMWVCLFER